MLYLASPYTHEEEAVRIERFRTACLVAARLIREGKHVFSPIAHSHPIAEHGLPIDADYWMKWNLEMMGTCCGMIVLRLEGWEASRGVEMELAKAREWGMPVEFLDPPTAATRSLEAGYLNGVGGGTGK